MQILARTYLRCTDGAHNKQYLAELVEHPDGSYSTPCAYGAIGARLSTTVKYTGTDRRRAVAAFEKVIAEKLGKGYVEVPAPASLGGPIVAAAAGGAVPAPVSGPDDCIPRFGAQLAGDGGAETLYDAVRTPTRYRVEEKWDGWRALVSFTPDGVVAIRNRDGVDKGRIANLSLLATALHTLGEAVPALYEGSVLDGELVGPTFAETTRLVAGGNGDQGSLRFVVFDLPFFAGVDRRDTPLSLRIADLERVLAHAAPPIVGSPALVPVKELAELVWAAGGEGLIIKQLDAPYLSGGRTAWQKVKRVLTADAVVIGLEPGQGKHAGTVGALIVAQHDATGALVEVARVAGFTDSFRRAITPALKGRVVEFAYQERTTAGRYRHPRFLRLRVDKAPADCVVGT
jgi:predicted DNA-binding WGR domain protein